MKRLKMKIRRQKRDQGAATLFTFIALSIIPLIGIGCGGKKKDQNILGLDSGLEAALYASHEQANQRTRSDFGQTASGSKMTQKKSSAIAQTSRQNSGINRQPSVSNAGGGSGICAENPAFCKDGAQASLASLASGGVQGAGTGSDDVGSNAQKRSVSAILNPNNFLKLNNLVSREDPPLVVHESLCDELTYEAFDAYLADFGDDNDDINSLCEARGYHFGYAALSPWNYNGYKVAAVKIPEAQRDIFTQLSRQKLTPNSDAIRRLVNVDRLRDWLEKGRLRQDGFDRIQVLQDRNDNIYMPASNEVGLVESGNRKNWLTFSGVDDPTNPFSIFDITNLPGMSSNEDSMEENDGFVYVVESMISYPTGYNPSLKVVRTGLEGILTDESSGLVVFVNGTPVIHTFGRRSAVAPSNTATLNSQVCGGVDCHLVVLLYSERREDSAGRSLIESLFIDVNPNDGRGFEPLPSEIAAPIVGEDNRYSKINFADQVIRIHADPQYDQGLMNVCQEEWMRLQNHIRRLEQEREALSDQRVNRVQEGKDIDHLVNRISEIDEQIKQAEKYGADHRILPFERKFKMDPASGTYDVTSCKELFFNKSAFDYWTKLDYSDSLAEESAKLREELAAAIASGDQSRVRDLNVKIDQLAERQKAGMRSNNTHWDGTGKDGIFLIDRQFPEVLQRMVDEKQEEYEEKCWGILKTGWFKDATSEECEAIAKELAELRQQLNESIERWHNSGNFRRK